MEEKQFLFHIVWFDSITGWSDKKGKTILQMESDLLTFAKRLFHQLGQLEYQERSPAVPSQDYQKLQEAIAALEHVRPEKHTYGY